MVWWPCCDKAPRAPRINTKKGFFTSFCNLCLCMWPHWQLSWSAPALHRTEQRALPLPWLQRNLGKTSKCQEVQEVCKACLAPLQTWGQRGLSKPPDPTHRRTLAHALRVTSHSFSLPLNDLVISSFPQVRNCAYPNMRAASKELLFPAIERPNNPKNPLGSTIWNWWTLVWRNICDKKGWDFDRTQSTSVKALSF